MNRVPWALMIVLGGFYFPFIPPALSSPKLEVVEIFNDADEVIGECIGYYDSHIKEYVCSNEIDEEENAEIDKLMREVDAEIEDKLFEKTKEETNDREDQIEIEGNHDTEKSIFNSH